MKLASIDIDAQKGFTPLCPDELPVPDGHLIAEALNAQAKLADIRVASKDAHPVNAIWVASTREQILTPIDAENADLRWPVHCVPATKGFELLDGLPKPSEYDFFVWKGIEPDMHPYGACYHDLKEQLSTGLIEYLTGKGVDTVLAGGLATDYCVKTTAIQLQQAGFRVIVNLPACRGINQDTITQAISAMSQAGIELAHDMVELKQLLSTRDNQ